jgi:UDP-N-acetylmuramoyl-tripeptide--D-alanyl-D-alanine ligase
MTAYYLIFFLTILWFIRTIKSTLFYLYLWQLKEYHVGRFIDHFRTDKGKKLFFNRLFYLKVLLAVIAIPLLLSGRYLGRTPFLSAITVIIFALYIFEDLLFFRNIFKKTVLKPVFTKKMAFLGLLSLFITIIFYAIITGYTTEIFSFAFWLLILDIYTPLTVSLAILIVQPFVVLYRNRYVLEKAKNKIAQRKDLKVIGITGSYGKTSTKEFLSTILSLKYKVLKTKKHQNSEMGISRCILDDLNPEHEIFVVEMGAYGVGGIKLLSDIANPRIGILTGINEQHLSLFGSQANIIKTKYELIESLPKDGLAIFNGENKYCRDLFKTTGIPKKLYRLSSIAKEMVLQPDIWAENIKVEKNHVSFKAKTKKGEEADIKVNVLGRQNVLNILAAVLTANELGMNLKEIKEACLKITPDQASMVLVQNNKDFNILNSSYSANPDGVIADLEYLKLWPGRKIIIMPCMIELGSASKEAHQRVGRKIAEVCDLAIITSSERFDEIEKAAISSGMKSENIILLEKPEEVLIQVDIFAKKDDVVLLEGRVPKKIIDSL